MRALRRVAALAGALACVGACGGPGGKVPKDMREGAGPHPGERGEHGDHADAHVAHAHPTTPTTVELSPAVIAAAGIVSAPIERVPLAPVIDAYGALAADPARTFAVAAKVGGIVDAVEVREGDRVVEGQALARIRAPSLGGLRADVAALRARAAAARANADRLDVLVGKQMASKQELAAARAEAAALAAEARAAEQRLRALGVGAGGSATAFVLRSPTAGVVTARAVMEGQAVTAEDAVVTITNLEQAWFMARVFEHALDRVEVGAAAEVALNAFPGRRLAGVVDLLSPAVDPHARTVTARIVVQNPEGDLRLGLFGRARIAARGAPSTPTLALPGSTSATTSAWGSRRRGWSR